MAVWGPVAGFFKTMWDGITAVFEKALTLITGIVDKVTGAPQQAKITVDFANAPKGTRVSTDPKSSADVDLGVGYQMGSP
jgi:hypothetical protein